MEQSRRSPVRILAPAGIAAFAIALVLILSGGNGSSGGTSADRAAKARDLGPTTTTTAATRHHHRSSTGGGSGALPQSVYVVHQNDTLGGIAQKTGIPISKLQDLNPGLDQFSLVAGQRIKLR